MNFGETQTVLLKNDRSVIFFFIFNCYEVLSSVFDKQNLLAEIFSHKFWLNFLLNLGYSDSCSDFILETASYN